jgi:hypothetical protein
MNAGDRTALWDRLIAAGLATGDAPASEDAEVPWYVRTMIGVAGWIAAAFLLGFVGVALAFVTKSGPASVTFGLLLCGAAIAALWTLSRHEFFAQFALAVSLAGQALVVAGLFLIIPHHDASVYVAIAAFETALALLAPTSVHRAWSAFAAALAFFLALHEWRATAIFPAVAAAAFVALQAAETRLVANAGLWRATSAGVALAMLAIVPASSVLDMAWLSGRPDPPAPPEWAASGALLAGIVCTGTMAWLLAKNAVALTSRAGIATVGGSIALAVAAWPVPGVIVGVLVAVVSFAAGRVAMTGLGLVAVAAALSFYYYSLEAPLLTKALSLLAVGAVLFALRFVLRHWSGSNGAEARNA